MKHPVDQRRRGLLHSLFLADPLRKLIAIGLAVGLWYYLDSQVSDTVQMDLWLREVEAGAEPDWAAEDRDPSDLYVQIPPARWTLGGFENALTGQPILGVTLDFSGPKHLISRLREEQPRFTAFDPGVEDLEPQGGFEFSVDNIRVSSDFQALIERMTPSRVKVVLRRNIDRQIPLTTERIEFRAPPGYASDDLFFERAVFSVPEVTIYGPREGFPDLLSTPKPFEVQLIERTPELVGGNLILLEKFADFTMEPQTPNVTIPVQPKPSFYDLMVPVFVDDMALPEERRGRFVAEEPRVQITLAASGKVDAILASRTEPERKQRWADDFLRLHVRLRQEFDGSPDTQEAVIWVLDPGIDRRDYRLSGPVPVRIIEKQEGKGTTDGK